MERTASDGIRTAANLHTAEWYIILLSQCTLRWAYKRRTNQIWTLRAIPLPHDLSEVHWVTLFNQWKHIQLVLYTLFCWRSVTISHENSAPYWVKFTHYSTLPCSVRSPCARTHLVQLCPTTSKRSICISNFMQTTFFYVEKILKKLEDDQCKTIFYN